MMAFVIAAQSQNEIFLHGTNVFSEVAPIRLIDPWVVEFFALETHIFK